MSILQKPIWKRFLYFTQFKNFPLDFFKESVYIPIGRGSNGIATRVKMLGKDI